ncbi:MAG: D-glycero-beta-D-manno-heptose 1-phosphate adenylyltransferase [Elusimicrobiota bacterium]
MKRVYSSISSFCEKIEEIREGKKVVFTNGCFDILHVGHIHLLKEAKKQGDVLIVGLNSDKSVKKIKGPLRPVIKEKDRAAVLAELRPVDFVVFFNRETPYTLIKKIKPDVLVKGGEYCRDKIVGHDIVSDTRRIKMKKGFSTTEIIKKAAELSGKENAG